VDADDDGFSLVARCVGGGHLTLGARCGPTPVPSAPRGGRLRRLL
jgi:hypothetical protein